MASFFRYIWHCIWGALGYLGDYGQNNYSWKDLGVAMFIFLLICTIIIITKLIIRYKPTKNNFSDEEQN